MKTDEKEYRCSVCLETVFENIQKFPLFTCYKCQTHFIGDNIGIKIAREPPEKWKKLNKSLWDSVKKILSFDNYFCTIMNSIGTNYFNYINNGNLSS